MNIMKAMKGDEEGGEKIQPSHFIIGLRTSASFWSFQSLESPPNYSFGDSVT
jgi:hypothetical protein